MMNIFPQRLGEICLNNNFKWVLDGVEITHLSHLEVRIGGHWIYGIVFEHKARLYWSSWEDCVVVDISLGIKARWSDRK
ncbi:MAG: hypothetical protein AB7O96_09825 [Pseudobdellovibrionaceae bacterium]